jgi:hypothetical protein
MTPKKSRHGRRAENKTQTSVSLSADLLEKARAQAESEGRTFSNWLEQMLKEKLRDQPEEAQKGKQ